ncbi:MAG TPA: FAD-dependent oxidoreductase, partial [Polyangiaceae bacterium]
MPTNQSAEQATRPSRGQEHRSPWRPSGLVLEASDAQRWKEQQTADVCVIGAGMAGLLCALELAERGRSVMVLERAHVGAGDT